MQYYPRDNLAVRARRKPLSVTETLRTAIQIASAVETAHRAGVLHRDIKPANILTSEFGHPGLTDFGISATKADGVDGEGMSIPWSPPEAFRDDSDLDERSDVYSLGATVHTFLTGRSPFDIPGGDNDALHLMERIDRMPVPPSGRGDVPPSLERVLAQSMSKQPMIRHASALAFARDLQAVEQELHLKLTPIDVPNEAAEDVTGGDSDAEETRGRIATRIVPSGPELHLPTPAEDRTRPPTLVKSGTAAASDPIGISVGAHERWSSPSMEEDGTRQRARVVEEVSAPSSDEAQQPRSKVGLIVAAIALLVVGVVVIITLISRSPTSPKTAGQQSTTSAPDAIGGGPVPTPSKVSVVASGSSVTVSWTNPAPQPGDWFQVSETVAGQQFTTKQTGARSLVANNVPVGQFCADVELIRQNGQTSTPSVATCTS
jgi:serine/threonine protein kinase